MAVDQTVLFTIIPRGVTSTGDTMPVSVFITPRLRGDNRLGAFPDWLHWTKNLKDKPPQLTISCTGAAVDNITTLSTSALRPDLWDTLFNDRTLVNSHKFDDYTDRAVISYPVRDTLSLIKAVYQEAGLLLALPDRSPANKERNNNRRILENLTEGFDVHWDGNLAPKFRAQTRDISAQPVAGSKVFPLNVKDSEGLYGGPRNPGAVKTLTNQFSVFHHMPTPPLDELKLDAANALDFHQALSSLNSYPDLLRALGLVFDFDLPRTFVTVTPFNAPGSLTVKKVGIGWRTPTIVPAQATDYLHATVGAFRIFVPAPRQISEPNAPTAVLGALNLDPDRFGLAQVDVDGAVHKTIMLADSLHNSPNPDLKTNRDSNASPQDAAHPEVFDPGATLPSLRSGGFSLYADQRGFALLDTLGQSKNFNQALEGNAPQPRPFFAEDLMRGYRLDVWDSHAELWHSLHRRKAEYIIGEGANAKKLKSDDEEGFFQLAAMQPAKGAIPADKDFYLHEAMARWVGWSLSVPRPSRALSKFADPKLALPDPADPNDPAFATDQPVTPFKLSSTYHVVQGSLPALRFGRRYRFRARGVDLAGNSLKLGDPFLDLLSAIWGLPRDPDGIAYLRYEPVIAPLVVMRDPKAVTSPGSAIDRIVIRTSNNHIDKDGVLSDAADADSTPADTTSNDRHLIPPRTSVEMGERMGMFDDANGKLKSDSATWQLIGKRDAAELPQINLVVAERTDNYPIISDESVASLPYLPDPFSRGVALRDLPGTPEGSLSGTEPETGAEQPLVYNLLSDPNPRPGSATLLHFGKGEDWQNYKGLRMALTEPKPGQTALTPTWDPVKRLLTVFLAKGETKVTPLSSFMTTDDLKKMGVWKWLREFIETVSVFFPQQEFLLPGSDVDLIAHILQRTVEGGHWMLNPPRLLTFVHAVQQPIGRPQFTALPVNYQPAGFGKLLQAERAFGRKDPTELAPITGWRQLDASDAFLLGALKVHGASTAKVDINAQWVDILDDPAQPGPVAVPHSAPVDEIPLQTTDERFLRANGADFRLCGYYDPEHDQIAFVQAGDFTGDPADKEMQFGDAAPRHQIGDTKHHKITYTAVSASRYQEYFPQDQSLDFTRSSAPVVVDIPASTRPLAPDIAYVLPTFGWQRQTQTNLKRSVRYGGGLRVYLHRPWFSSGIGELLGVNLWSFQNGSLNQTKRDALKPYFTQYGMDPIWQTANLSGFPSSGDFPDAVSSDFAVSLEEKNAVTETGAQAKMDVVGFETHYDETRKLWYADLTLNIFSETYSPFVRLALTRYQPNALEDAKISRVALADFAQLTPTRVATITSDPGHARTVRVVVSGLAPRGPRATIKAEPLPKEISPFPTKIRVKLQERDPAISTDLTWRDASPGTATVEVIFEGRYPDIDHEMWIGTVTFAKSPDADRYRLLIEETEYISAKYVNQGPLGAEQPGRLIYAETVLLDSALVTPPTA